ncbi:MAG: radical SAM protein [Oscillospiraceae bacterium]|nr:radical SAM protein [Oscillospiraceae bacterium]
MISMDIPRKFDRVIVYRITQDCNMRCRFCSYSCDVMRKRDSADPRLIQCFSGTLGDYKRVTGKNILVSWIGGEPFLYGDIIPLSRMLRSNGICVSATTNGTLLSESIIRDICGLFSEIVISLDSFEACNDDVRQLAGHFSMVSDKIRLLDRIRRETGSGLKIKVNTILMRRNISDFESFCQFLAGLGVDEVTFNRLGGYDRPDFFGDNRLLYSQSERFANEFRGIKERLSEQGLIIHGSGKYMERFLSAARDIPSPVEECDPGSYFWFINENGFISPCSYTSYEYMFDLRDINCPADFDRAEAHFRNMRSCCRSKWCDDCFCTQVYDKFE